MGSCFADLAASALVGRRHFDISVQLGEALLTRASSADVFNGVVTRIHFTAGAPLQAKADAAGKIYMPTTETLSMPAPVAVPQQAQLPPGLNVVPKQGGGATQEATGQAADVISRKKKRSPSYYRGQRARRTQRLQPAQSGQELRAAAPEQAMEIVTKSHDDDDIVLDITATDAARDAAECTAAARLQACVRGRLARGQLQRLKRARDASSSSGAKLQRAEGTPAALAPASERVSFSAMAQRSLFTTPPPSPSRERRQDLGCNTPAREHHADTPPSAVPKGWAVLRTGRAGVGRKEVATVVGGAGATLGSCFDDVLASGGGVQATFEIMMLLLGGIMLALAAAAVLRATTQSRPARGRGGPRALLVALVLALPTCCAAPGDYQRGGVVNGGAAAARTDVPVPLGNTEARRLREKERKRAQSRAKRRQHADKGADGGSGGAVDLARAAVTIQSHARRMAALVDCRRRRLWRGDGFERAAVKIQSHARRADAFVGTFVLRDATYGYRWQKWTPAQLQYKGRCLHERRAAVRLQQELQHGAAAAGPAAAATAAAAAAAAAPSSTTTRPPRGHSDTYYINRGSRGPHAEATCFLSEEIAHESSVAPARLMRSLSERVGGPGGHLEEAGALATSGTLQPVEPGHLRCRLAAVARVQAAARGWKVRNLRRELGTVSAARWHLTSLRAGWEDGMLPWVEGAPEERLLDFFVLRRVAAIEEVERSAVRASSERQRRRRKRAAARAAVGNYDELLAASHKTASGRCFHTIYAKVAGLDRVEGDYLIDVRPGHGAGGYYEFYYQGELEGDDEDDYDAMIGGLYFEDPAHELFGFISGLEGLDEDSGWLGA